MDGEKLANDLQKVEDTAIEKLNKEFKASVQKTIAETDWTEIERRLASMQEAGDVADSVAWQEYDPRTYLEETLFPLASELSAAAIADVVGQGTSLSFTVTDPNALKWLKQYGAEEIKYISDSQRKAIKDIVTRGYADGVTYQQQAREIKQLIGLDPRRAEAVQRMRAKLLERGLISDEKIDRRAARYAEKLLNQRARNIAVQEATTAGARAFYETTADACSRGILDPHIYEGYRIVTGDERLCAQCSGLAGEARRLPDGAYQSGSVTPKLHALCRCVEGVRAFTTKKSAFVPAEKISSAMMRAGKLGVELDNGYIDRLDIMNYALEWAEGRSSKGLPLPKKIKINPINFKTWNGKQDNSVVAKLDRKTNDIYINSNCKYWDDPAKYGGEAKAAGWWESHNQLDHEMGHYLHVVENPKLARKALENYGEPAGNIPGELKSEMSKYGQTTQAEFIAEVYSGSMGGKKYSGPVMKAYEKWGGPKL